MLLKRLLPILVFLLLLHKQGVRAQIAQETVQKGKRATVLVEVNNGKSYGTAFCIANGFFVTNEHVVRDLSVGEHVTLILRPGEKEQQKVAARIARIAKESDLALLFVAALTDSPALPLGDDSMLTETQEVVAFGYPFGSDLALGQGEYPATTVSTGRISALRKTQGQLVAIQLEGALNPGNSGGPVLNNRGEVIGIVEAGIPGAGINVAIPVDILRSLLETVTLAFTPAAIAPERLRQKQDFVIELDAWKRPKDITVTLTLRAGNGESRTYTAHSEDGHTFRFKAVLLPITGAEEGEPFTFHIEARQGNKVIAEQSGTIPVGHAADPIRHSGGAQPGIVPANLKTRINPKDGALMIFIPAGPFLMGDDDQAGNPRHKVTLSGYWIYQNPVTVRQYKQFCQETHRQMPPEPVGFEGNHFNPNWSKDDHPIVQVTWEEAVAYGKWAFGDDRIHLPSEAQWEKAARGTDGRKFPWGDHFDGSRLWRSKERKGDSGGTAPVGVFSNGASPFGVLDMAGNIYQWCQDFYSADYWSQSPLQDPKGPPFGNLRVLRGGSWYDPDLALFRTSYRFGNNPEIRGIDYGFRCASSP
jgi:formylglycine-generating enzyme required for sulfatase activity